MMNSDGVRPSTGERQRLHYEAIHDDYGRHYYDPLSMAYRREFIIDPMIAGLTLDDGFAAEIACGIGANSQILASLRPTIRLMGFDVSKRACSDYQVSTGAPAKQCDLTQVFTIDEKFDFVFVVGGLHHCVSDLNSTLRNVEQLLKPGGIFAMAEPNGRFALEGLRRLWYRLDKYFDSQTELALDHDMLHRQYGGAFDVIDVSYVGGLAYFLVLNSLIFRLPQIVKRWLAPSLLWHERQFDRVSVQAIHPMFIARWRLRD